MDLMGARRRLLMMQNELPHGFRRVDYIESTGTQYIDTGVEPTINTEWFVDFSNFNKLNDRYAGLGGAGAAGSYINVSVDTNNYERSYASFGNITDRQFASTTLGVGYWNDGRHTILISKEGVWMDGIDTLVKFTGATFVPNGDTICIFARKQNSSIQRYIKARIFSNEIRSNGTLVSRLVPCVRKTDSKPGMYDTVSKTFCTNAGTGEFIVPN